MFWLGFCVGCSANSYFGRDIRLWRSYLMFKTPRDVLYVTAGCQPWRCTNVHEAIPRFDASGLVTVLNFQPKAILVVIINSDDRIWCPKHPDIIFTWPPAVDLDGTPFFTKKLQELTLLAWFMCFSRGNPTHRLGVCGFLVSVAAVATLSHSDWSKKLPWITLL